MNEFYLKINEDKDGDTIKSERSLVGMKEFANLLGWSTARLSTKYNRQREGRNVRPKLPEPIEVLASTPIWTKEQALDFKSILQSKENNT